MAEDLRLSRVYVGNVGLDVTREKIQMAFSQCGNVMQVWLGTNPPGFAFVFFETVDEAERACEMFHGKEALGSSELKVEIVKRKSDEDADDSE